ncbi:class I SAM-dependent methyltransferase [bacterium]|nr:class I SAM-dependent methyltransferase [bacterium]
MESNEGIYRAHEDPWGYFSAAEQIKYERTVAAARRWKAKPERVLEVACSLGHMTRLLASYADEVWAYDVSPTAVERARQRCADLPGGRLHIDVGDALAPDYPPDYFDVIFIGDVGLGAHRDIGGAMIREAIPLLRDEGLLVVVDNMKPRMQESYAAFVEHEGVDVIDRIWFDDRYWARFRRAVTWSLPPPCWPTPWCGAGPCSTVWQRWAGVEGRGARNISVSWAAGGAAAPPRPMRSWRPATDDVRAEAGRSFRKELRAWTRASPRRPPPGLSAAESFLHERCVATFPGWIACPWPTSIGRSASRRGKAASATCRAGIT